ncbi:MAG: hypothetical protein LBF40_03960 [Deltaproteobacteria bacterium]|jgi:hypothetical protein|nr:hypothetical protein [Deltaproteobacteria bacterium]
MKKSRLLALAAMALSLAFIGTYATTAESQAPTDAQVQTGTLSETVWHPTCPKKMATDITVKYPENTGNDQVDAFFAEEAAKYLTIRKNEFLELEPYICEYNFRLYAKSGYKSFKPNPETLGVITSTESFTGGANSKITTQSNNFDLITGQEITIEDLFIDPRMGISGIYGFAYADLCNKTETHEAAWWVLTGKCGTDKKAPSKVLGLKGPLDKLGHLVLTERGADLNFIAYEIWSYGQGSYTLSIPKDTLIEFGAMDFWGQSASHFWVPIDPSF